MPLVENDIENNRNALYDAMNWVDAHNRAGVRCLFGKDNDEDAKAIKKLNRKRKRHGEKPIKAHCNRFYKRTMYAEKYAHVINNHIDRMRRNWYLSVNSFAVWKRSNSTVLGLNGIYDDIDCEKNGISCSDFYINRYKVLKLAKLPRPNLFISSGHGFYFAWLFTHQRINHSHRFLKLWKHLASTISLRLNRACKQIFGKEPVDIQASQDPSRVLRMPDTLNWKNPTHLVRCRLQSFQTSTMEMNDWVARYLPKYHSNNSKRLHSTSKRHKHGGKVFKLHPNNFSPYSLLWGRRHDMMNWAYFARKGHREVLLFKLACTDSHVRAISEIEQDIKVTNQRFIKSLPKSEIHDLIVELHHIDFRKYKIEKTSELISELGISANFQKHARVLKLPQYKHMGRKTAHRKRLSQKKHKWLWIGYLLVTGATYRQIQSKYGYSMRIISKVSKMRNAIFDKRVMEYGISILHNR